MAAPVNPEQEAESFATQEEIAATLQHYIDGARTADSGLIRLAFAPGNRCDIISGLTRQSIQRRDPRRCGHPQSLSVTFGAACRGCWRRRTIAGDYRLKPPASIFRSF